MPRWINCNALKIIATTLSLLGMPGCYEVVPVKATQELTIHKDGSIEVSYIGEFTDLRLVAEAMEAGKRKEPITPSLAERERFLGKIRDIEGVKTFEYLGADTYKLAYHAKGKAQTAGIPRLIDGSSAEWVIPSLVQLRLDRDQLTTPDEQNARSRREWEEISRGNDALAKEVNRLLRQMKGTLRIHTNGYVRHHNAEKVRNLPNGMAEYEWRVNGGSVFKVQFSMTLHEPDDKQFDPARYPPGTDCIKAFGEECQCSFVLKQQNTDDPLVNRAYRIEAGRGKVVEGCTDVQGNTMVLTSRVTGPCTVILLTESESAKRCKVAR